MAVVQIAPYRDPVRRQVTVYCVQAYWRDRRGLAKGKFQQFASVEVAMRAARTASARAAGVLVYVMRGYPGTDTWDEPAAVARFGDVPIRACADQASNAAGREI